MRGNVVSDPPSIGVVAAVAAALEVDPVDLDPFAGRLNLEALDDLLATSSVPVRVECTVDGLVVAVEVESDGNVRVSSVPVE